MKFFLKFVFLVVFFTSTLVSLVSAQGFLGFDEPEECKIRDRNGVASILPVLVICGRSPATGACPAYTTPCTLGHLAETGRRILVWVIMVVLMIIPVVIAYYGAIMIIYRENSLNGDKLKNIKDKIFWLVVYFVCLLGAWIIVRTIVDIAQVDPRINTFLIENGQQVKARQFDFSR